MRLVLEQGYSATSAEQASTAIQAVFGVGAVSVVSRGSLRYDQWSLVDDGISMTRIQSSGASVQMDAAPAPDMVVIAVRTGSLVLTQGAETVTLQADELGLVPLEQAVRATWEQVTMEVYSFPRSSLGHLLTSDTARLSLHVARLKAASPALIRLWNRTAASLVDEVLENSELVESDVVREMAIEALLGLTIEAFGISDANDDDDTDDASRLERATAYMRDHISSAISVSDVARDLGVSIRSLQLVFQRTGNATPLAYLRALRMAAAQHLLSTGAASTSIAEVARQMGYFNLGRFDAHYLDAFDRLPEHDLPAASITSGSP